MDNRGGVAKPSMKKGNLFFGVMPIAVMAFAVVSFLVLIFFSIQRVQHPVSNSAVACSEEAKLCPNGSYVGRTGPNCVFAACPESGTLTNASNNRNSVSRPPRESNVNGPASNCITTGCSHQVCSDAPVVTTCEFRPEYACYRSATCARQADGQCGWTMTDELRQCLNQYQPGSAAP